MSPLRRFDHVGITVADPESVAGFFVGLGFEIEGRTVLEGEFLDTVIGIPDSRTEKVMLRQPDGGQGWPSEPAEPGRSSPPVGVCERARTSGATA